MIDDDFEENEEEKDCESGDDYGDNYVKENLYVIPQFRSSTKRIM